MLYVKFIKENYELLKNSLSKRGQEEKAEWLDIILERDKKWRALKQKADKLRQKRNELTNKIRELKSQKKQYDLILKQAQSVPGKITLMENEMSELSKQINSYLEKLPNILHEKVPLGKDEKDNIPFKFFKERPTTNSDLLSHSELLEKTNLANFDAGRINSGQGFNYLTGELAELDLALQRFGIDFLLKKGFKLVVPPLALNKKTLGGTVPLDEFNDVIYKIEGEDLYLIATAEQPLVSLNSNKTFNKEDLPIKICAITPCFRKEIGSRGVDTKGLFRMHQFNKVEQVVISDHENSYNLLEEMESLTEDFFKKLELPFRVIEICSGDLGPKQTKQYDIEAWFPRQQEYQEVTSASNTGEYQSATLNIKYVEGEEKKFCHLLNNTMVATSRAMVAIIENFQNKDGTIKIPKALRKYMNGKKKIGGFKK
ncbi:serine--tRNA ligase [Candidatus Woesearchaeota archaeon]|nr:serine--tRNA ligase [Candidatus Woesearchaeota archaeon]MBT4322344.1 serine--tRNA ligase [Candidatus Woesearchaeota archaeon]MBT4630956.1 serine--tRNA ligase [Candidatus Woesearchaeota archaeon]